MKEPTTCVIIVSWNSKDDVLACLQALERQTQATLEVIVVDNGSSDGTAPAIRAAFPRVHLYASAENQGFARAANIGLRSAVEHNWHFALLLNPDTQIEPEFVSRLVAFADSHVELGIISPKVYLKSGREQLWGVGGVLRRDGITFFGLSEPDVGQYDDRELDFVLGCAMLIRTSVLRQIGVLDERFFVFFEEIDLCLRAKDGGWRIGLAPRVHLTHAGGASTAGNPSLRQFYLARSRLLFLHKHRARFDLAALVLCELIHTRKVLVGALRQRDPRSVIRYIDGLRVGLLRCMFVERSFP